MLTLSLSKILISRVVSADFYRHRSTLWSISFLVILIKQVINNSRSEVSRLNFVVANRLNLILVACLTIEDAGSNLNLGGEEKACSLSSVWILLTVKS